MNNKVYFEVNAIGEICAEWRIPLKNVKGEILGIPGYKYEMPRILGILVPFSSIAYPTEYDCLSCKLINYKNEDILKETPMIITKHFGGSSTIRLSLDDKISVDETIAVLRFILRDFVNRDYLFFNFVYALSLPNNKAKLDVIIKAHFSYLIRRASASFYLIDLKTGRRAGKFTNFKFARRGDNITIVTRNMDFTRVKHYDFYITATRLPVFFRRDYFWLAIYSVFLVVFLLPLIKLIFGLE